MLIDQPVSKFLDELASGSPAPGGGSVAALSGALGAALASMVCHLTIGKKKYLAVEPEMKNILQKSDQLRRTFAALIDRDAEAFNRVMDAYGLPKDTDDQKALRTAAIQAATKEAALVPLEVMKHAVDALALTKAAVEKGNSNSVSDAGASAIMLDAAANTAALNVKINLNSISDTEFTGWRSEEVTSLLRTCRATSVEILALVKQKLVDA